MPRPPSSKQRPQPLFLVGRLFSPTRHITPSRHHWTWMYTPTPGHKMGRLPPSVKSWRTRPGPPLRGPQWPGLVAHPLGLLLTLHIWRLASIKTVHPSNFLGDHRLARKKECEDKKNQKNRTCKQIWLTQHFTKGSVSYLSSPCFSTIIGGIGGPARAIHGILAVMYWISIIRGGPPL